MRAILALLILAAVAPAAQAASRSIPARIPDVFEHGGTGAIALAGEDVVWVEGRGTRAVLLAAGEDGVAREVASLPPRAGAERTYSVVASGTTVVWQRHVCRRDCTRGDRAEAVRIDLTTGAAAPLDLCPRDREKAFVVEVTLRGSVLGADCSTEGRVTDLADGTTWVVEERRLMAAAGPFAAVIDDRTGAETITVRNWRTGAVVSRVAEPADEPVEDLDLDVDGTLAFVRGAAVHVVAPGARADRRPMDVQELGLAGGVLATRSHSLGAFNRFRVGDQEVDGQDGAFGWAFDGARLVWVAQPCAQTVVQVWDLAADPPLLAEPRCATARVGTVRLTRRSLRVRLTCPKTAPVQGCGGFVRADLLGGGRRRGEGGPAPYKLAPGAATTVGLGVEEHLRRPLVARVKVNDASTRRRVR